MDINNYNTNVNELKEVRQNSHLNYKNRVQIETLLNQNYSIKEIAIDINRPIRTIQHELSKRKFYLLKGTFCFNCKNNISCDIAINCQINKTFGSCEQKECNSCPTSTCNGYKKINTCKKSIILYTVNAAHNHYLTNRKNCKQPSKINSIMGCLEYIKNGILNDKYSPDTLSGRMKLMPNIFKDTVCTQTIYIPTI